MFLANKHLFLSKNKQKYLIRLIYASTRNMETVAVKISVETKKIKLNCRSYAQSIIKS